MANPLAALKSFAATKRGKVVLGGTAAGGVVVAGLVTRRRAGGDPTAPGADTTSAPPYAIAPATGTSGTNTDAFPTINSPGIDVGQFEQLLSDFGRIADAAEANQPKPAPANPAPSSSGQVPGEIWYTVKTGDTIQTINKLFYGHTDYRGLADANKRVLVGGQVKPGTVIVVPKAGRLA